MPTVKAATRMGLPLLGRMANRARMTRPVAAAAPATAGVASAVETGNVRTPQQASR